MADELLGDAILELGADWDPLRRQLDQAGAYTRTKMDEMARSTGQFQRSLDTLGSALRNFTQGSAQINAVTASTRQLIDSYRGLTGAVREYELAARDAARQTQDFGAKLEAARRTVGLTIAQIDLMTKAVGLAKSEFKNWQVEIDETVSSIGDLNSAVGEFINLHQRVKSLGPLLSPEDRQAIIAMPAYQGLMRTARERQPAGQRVTQEGLPQDVAAQLVENINIGRRIEQELLRVLADREYSIIGGGTFRRRGGEGEGGARGGAPPPALPPAPMGREFFDQLGQEMDRVMAPVRKAWADGINVQTLQAEATTKAVQQEKEALDSIKQFVARAIQEGPEAEPEAPPAEAALASALEQAVSPLGDKLDRNTQAVEALTAIEIARQEFDKAHPQTDVPEGMMTRQQIEQLVYSERGRAMSERAFGIVPPSRMAPTATSAVHLLGGAKSPESPVNANNPLPVGVERPSDTGLASRAANIETPTVQQIEAAPAGTGQAATTGATTAPTPITRVPTEQGGQPGITPEQVQSALQQRDVLLAQLQRGGRAPYVSRYTPGMTPTAYEQLTGTPYGTPQRALPIPATEPVRPGDIARLPRGRELVPSEPTSSQIAGMLASAAVREAILENIRALESGPLAAGGAPRRAIRPMPRSGTQYRYLDTPGRLRPGLARGMGGAPGEGYLSQATAQEFEHYLRMLAEPHQVPLAGRGFTMPGRAGQPTAQDIWDYIMHQRPEALGPGYVAPRRSALPRGYGADPRSGVSHGPRGPAVGYGRPGDPSAQVVPHIPEEQDAIRSYAKIIAVLHAIEQMRAEEVDPRKFSQEAANLFRFAQAFQAAGESAARREGGLRRPALPHYAMAGGTRYARPQVIEEQPIIEEMAPGGGGRGGGGAPPIAFAPGAGGGGGGGGDSILRRLLWGGGARIPLPFTMGGGIAGAGMGSLASLAGLGPEHVLMTLLGIGGFAAAGAAGAGTIAAGAAGTMAVGGGADLAVLKSTATDTAAIYQNYQNLQQAVEVYGKHSAQAALAQSQLNQQLIDLTGGGTKPGIGVLAEKQLAKNVSGLDALFDKQTQGARVQAANIMEQGVTLGRDYTPRVAQAAQANLSIINNSIKPLFTWLEGPQGIKIFNDLENQFKHNLPTAVHAFTQAVEILGKFVDAASSHTGNFTKHLDEFLTRINDRSQGYFVGLVDKLVGDFRMWENLIKLVYQDLKLIFTQNAGAGRDIVGALDGMLANLHSWLETSRGQGQLHTVFETHKDEVLALLKTLPTLISDFGHFYLNVSPPLTKALTGIVTVLGNILSDVSSISPQFATFVGGMMVMQKLGVLTPVLRGLSAAMRDTNKATQEMNALSTGGPSGGTARRIEGDIKTLESDIPSTSGLSTLERDLRRAGPGATTTTGGGPLSWLPGIGAGKKQTWMINKDGNLVAVAEDEAKKGGMFAGTIATVEQRLSTLGLTDTAAARIAPLLTGAAGAAITGAGGYLAGTAIQRATGLRQGGTASAAGGIIGTVGGGAIGGLITAGNPLGIMLGAGIGSGIATAVAPTVTHLFSSLFGSGSGQNYGREWVKGFEKAMPGLAPLADISVGPKQQADLVKSIEDTKNKAGKAWQSYKDELDYLKHPAAPGNTIMFGVQVSPAMAKETEQQVKKDYAHWSDLATQGGKDSANYWITAMQGVKVPTEFAFQQGILNTLQNQTTEPAKQGALTQMLAYAKSLEDNQQLPIGSINKIITAIENQFPQLTTYLRQTGQQSDQALADKMKLQQTQTQLASTMKAIQAEFGLTWVNPDVSGANWAKNVGTNAKDLQTIIHNSTGNTKQEAIQAFQELKQKTGEHLSSMVGDTRSKMGSVKALIAGGSQDAATQAKTHFTHFADSVYTAMKSGAVSTATGMNLIQQMTNQVLKEFGVKNLPNTAIHVENQVLKFEGSSGSAAGILNAALGRSGGNPGGGAFTVSPNAVNIGNIGKEQGGLVQVGAPGQRGPDTIPMNVGGMPIVVGAGEQVAVFNAHQQNVMNQRLADFGGLGGFFNTVNTPHSQYAEGGYVFPFPKNVPFSWDRIDQGQDMQEVPGGKVLAIGPGNVSMHQDAFSGFGPYYAWEQMSAGPLKGETIYYGHIKTTKTGPVNTGDVIGVTQSKANQWTAAPAGWLELGLTSALGHGIAGQGAAIAPMLHQLAQGSRVTGTLFGIGAPPLLQPPKVQGAGVVGAATQAAMNQATNAANQYIQAAAAAVGVGGAGGLPSLGPGSVADQIYRYFTGRGVSKIGIAGIIGNWMQESSLRTTAPGGGLAQWIGSRGSALAALAKSENVPMSDLAVQLQYAWSELRGSHASALAAIQTAKTPEEAATLFEQLFEGASVPMMQNRMNYARQAYKAGYERGGFVPHFARGGYSYGSTSTKPASEVDPTRSRHPTVHKTRTPSGATIKRPVKHNHPRLPIAKAPKGFKVIGGMPSDVYSPLNRINADDKAIAHLQDVLTMIQGEEALWPVAAIVTPLDDQGNPADPVVNWGNGGPTSLGGAPLSFQPGAVGTQNWGMMDPSSNTWQYGIDVRLGEIGPRGGLGGTSQDQATEMGLYNTILAKYQDEISQQNAHAAMNAAKKHMNKLVTEIGWYDQRGNFHSGMLQQLIDRLTLQEKWLAPNKSDIEAQLTNRFKALRVKVQNKWGAKRYKGETLRTILIDNTSEKQAISDANIPVKPPYNWLAAGMGTPSTGAQKADYWWAQERAREVAAVTNTATEQRKAIDLAAMKTYYETTLNQRGAMLGLSQEETDERAALDKLWSGKRITLQTQISTLKRQLSQDKTLLDALTGSSAYGPGNTPAGVLGQLSDLLDPQGSLQYVDIGTLKNVTIPTLKQEISQLQTTVPTASTSGTATALADAQNLADLQSQRMTIQAEALASQAVGFKVLTDALKTMPPFAGAFQTGGIVPGPLGEARTIIAHGGESVTPPNQQQNQTQPMRMLIRMEDNTTRVYLDDVEQQVQQSTSTAARHARRALPGRAGGLTR